MTLKTALKLCRALRDKLISGTLEDQDHDALQTLIDHAAEFLRKQKHTAQGDRR